jgi:hypothetical protein
MNSAGPPSAHGAIPVGRIYSTVDVESRDKKKPTPFPVWAFFTQRSLNDYDIFRLGTFLALSYNELDFLAFQQGFETAA